MLMYLLVILLVSDSVPIIRRYSGGGTVVVDNSTVFVTLILNVRFKCYFLNCCKFCLKVLPLLEVGCTNTTVSPKYHGVVGDDI
jgi:lipoate-protein ligase A